VPIDPAIVVAGLVVGFTVGLTGMGGGALMTPILVLLFNIDPLAAVSSDLVASFVMKPVGASVHLRRGTVDLRLVRWLVIGSVPSGFLGVLLLRSFGNGTGVQDLLKKLLGAALILAASTIVAKILVQRRRGTATSGGLADLVIRPLPTIAIGVIGGLVVGMTSVGSGSLMIVLLLVLYPSLKASQLVGTDLVQAIPLVGAASLGHLLFGDFKLGLTGALLVGALPGVYVGARMSAKAPDHLIRPVLVVVLAVSALKLLGAPTQAVGLVLVAAAVAAVATFVLRRARRGGPGPSSDPTSPPTVAATA
jgi:uncharacterized membrane protein YfcA